MNRRIPRRIAALACLAAAIALTLGACASGTSQGTSQATAARSTPSRAGCFDPALARGFATVDDTTLLVDSGSKHYRVQLDATCHGVDWAAALRFKGDPITGRVCGRFGDSVSWNNHDCQIERVDWITREEHAALLHPPEQIKPAQ